MNAMSLNICRHIQLLAALAPGINFESICNVCSLFKGQLLYILSQSSASKFLPFSKACFTAVPLSMKSMSALLEFLKNKNINFFPSLIMFAC